MHSHPLQWLTLVGGLLVSLPAPAGEAQSLPDQVRTPGFTNPDVTPSTMDNTICNPYWKTGSIRPPTSYTNTLKRKQIDDYGYDDKDMADYEEDHLIPLEVGGDPRERMNLWPESYKTQPNAKDKDRVETYLHMQVCARAIDLRVGQHKIATNWVALYNEMNEKMRHDPALRIALSLDNEANALNRVDNGRNLSFDKGTNEQDHATQDGEEGGLSAAQWHWIAERRASIRPGD